MAKKAIASFRGRVFTLHLQPAVLTLENLEKAVEVSGDRVAARRDAEQERKIAALEAKVAKKNAVIAEISEEYVTPKESLGEP